MKEPSISGVCTAAPEATPTLGNVMVAMRDGVRLATDVYLPDGYRIGIDAPLPIVLERTPYGKREVSRSEVHQGCPPAKRADIARYFAARGYAVVMQDCRGRYDSEGVFTKYVSEGEDGFDAMVWMARQPWSNGKIGTMGLSYAAHTQLAAACLNPPGLACMVMDSGGFSNGYHCGIRQGGVRTEASHVGVQPRPYQRARIAQPRRGRRAQCAGPPRMVWPHAVASGAFAARGRTGIRSVFVRAMDKGRL